MPGKWESTDAARELGKIDEAVLQLLVDDATSESATLEFKQQPHGTNDPDKLEFAKDVCAMANAEGGDIVFGIAEAKNVASKLMGMAPTGETYDALVRRLTLVLDAKVEPRLRLQFQKVDLASGNYIAIARVPSSFDGPHWIRYTQEQRRFVSRNGPAITDMSHEQVRAAFDRTATLAERARTLIEARLHKIRARQVPMPIDQGRPIVAFHLVPLAGLAGRHVVDLTQIFRTDYLQMAAADWIGTDRTFHFDGVIVHPSGEQGSYYGYRHVFRNGAFEIASKAGDDWTDRAGTIRKIVWSLDMTSLCRNALEMSLKMGSAWGYTGPAVISLALLDANGHQLAINQNSFQPLSRRVPDRAFLVVPEQWVEDIQTADVDSVLRPMLDMLWQAFGQERCLDYAADGAFKPRQGVR